MIGDAVGTRTGSDDRWERLADLYRVEQPGLVRLARLLTDDDALAEELVQEAFLRIHPKLDGLDSPGAYLRTAVVNLANGHHRHQAVRAKHPPAPPGAEPEPDLPFDRDPVWLALGALPDRARTVLILRFYLDLPDGEIAELIGARPGTVRSLASRGLARLQEELTR